MPSVKGSAGGVLIVSSNGASPELSFLPIEIKTQATEATLLEAVAQYKDYVGQEGWQVEDKVQLLLVDIEDLHKVIKCHSGRHVNEIIQLLHHASTYSAREVLLLIGGCKSLTIAILVKVGDVALFAYANCI